MKVSEITNEYLANYLRLDEPEDTEKQEIDAFLMSAVSYCTSYTGLSMEELDKHEDITTVVLLLVSDMFDNRNLYIEGKASNVNKAVERILSMHSVNLI